MKPDRVVINEIIKSYANSGKTAELYFFLDSNHVEIDLLIHENGTLYPIEIKLSSEPKAKSAAAFGLLEKMPSIKRGEGGVICTASSMTPLTATDRIPFWAI